MEAQPRNDYVLVRPDNPETMKGSLYLPPSAVKIITRGTVQALGPGYILSDGSRQRIEDLDIGTRVEFIAHPGQPIIEIDGTPHLLMKEVEITCVITGDEPPPMIMPDETDADEELEGAPELGQPAAVEMPAPVPA